MTKHPREQRIKRVLEGIDAALPAEDPEALRAVEAVRSSSPNHVITLLEEKGLLDEMLEAMTTRFRGRPLETISSEELIQIARDSVDETMGIEPLQREHTAFPEPRVSNLTPDGRAHQVMTQVAEIVDAWRSEESTALEAAASIEESLHGKPHPRR